MKIAALTGWTREQRSVVIASFLGWTLDAFDFFLLVFVLKDIAQEFNTPISKVTFAILLTLVLRALYGVAMGGEWGVGASLTMESIPPHARGLVSGLLQSGYPAGYFLASIVYGLLFPIIGWRGMFMVGVLPALLVLYIRRNVPESPAWNAERARTTSIVTVLRNHWRVAVYGILLMTAFSFFSHGTQ